jgi:hypothetical protein
MRSAPFILPGPLTMTAAHAQVLKDLFALDDGGASKASGRNLGSAMCQQGLVPLLLSFLVALGPIRGRAPRPAGPEAGQASSTQERPMDSSITSTAARFPRLPPYLGFRTDIVAGQFWCCLSSCSCFTYWRPLRFTLQVTFLL